jgi:hypothetical protein
MGIAFIIIGVIIWVVNYIFIIKCVKRPYNQIWGIIPGAFISGALIGLGLRFL